MKKTHFYMVSPDEEQGLLDFLRQESTVRIVCYKTLTSELDIRDTIPPLGSGYHHFYLWDVDHSCPPINEYIPTQDHYVIDSVNSEIMEFERCSIRYKGGEKMVRDGNPWVNIGRIAIHHKIWVGEELIERPKHFIAFFERARQWIKKNAAYCCKEPGYNGIYVFPSVEKFLKEGGAFGPY